MRINYRKLLVLFFSISILCLSPIFVRSIGSSAEATKEISFTHSLPSYEFADTLNAKENQTSVDIPVPSSKWNVTDINLNFSNIKLGQETFILEENGSSFKTTENQKEAWAVQINITERTTIFAAYIYVWVENPSDNPVYMQINGYDSDNNVANSIVYRKTELNFSNNQPGWYFQNFSDPITLSQGYYSLVLNASLVNYPSSSAKYHWFYNEENPTYPLDISYFNEKTNTWTAEAEASFRHKLVQKVNRTYNPEDINMTAHLNGGEYSVQNGSLPGTGKLDISDVNHNSVSTNLEISISSNQSFELIFDFNYRLSIYSEFFSKSTVRIQEGSDNLWQILPDFERCGCNYSVQINIPQNWENIKIFRDNSDVTAEITVINNVLYFSNETIEPDSAWKIEAISPQESFEINIPEDQIEPEQDFKIQAASPSGDGNFTFQLIDALGTLEQEETTEVSTEETTFSYTLSSNPHEGKWQVYVFWNNATTAGIKKGEFDVTVPFSIAPETLYLIIILIAVFATIAITTYTVVKQRRRIIRERREKIFNKYMDAINLNYVIVTEKTTGLDIYEQKFVGKEIDASLITGFLDAIRRFGIELTHVEDQSQTIKLEFHDSKILMSEYKNFRIILVMSDNPSDLFIDAIDNLSRDIEQKYGKQLENFKGRKDEFQGIQELLEKHLQISLIYPLKIESAEKIKEIDLTSLEKSVIKRAESIMKETNNEYFFVSSLLSKKGFQVRDAQLILNLIKKNVFKPIYL